MNVATFFLALTFGIHIVLVNLGIAISVLVPYLRWRSEKTGGTYLGIAAKKMMKFYAVIYGVAGVFGTAFTVFLASYYPKFIGLAGHITLIPFGLSILFIVVHFFSISAYWYGWDRWSRNTRNIIGAILAISALLIPFGFRAVFAFLNTPQGLVIEAVDGRKPALDLASALGNPTFLPLYLKSVFGALTAGMLAITGGFAYRYLAKGSEEDRIIAEGFIKNSLPWVILGMVAMLLLGAWYSMSLTRIEYKFNNIFGELGWRVGDGVVYRDYSWLFLIKILLVIFQGIMITYLIKSVTRNKIDGQAYRAAWYGGLAALATIVVGEYLNAFSQYPYFIADLTDPKVASSIPEPWRSTIIAATDMTVPNELATLGGVVGLTVVFLGALFTALVALVYLVFLAEEKR